MKDMGKLALFTNGSGVGGIFGFIPASDILAPARILLE